MDQELTVTVCGRQAVVTFEAEPHFAATLESPEEGGISVTSIAFKDEDELHEPPFLRLSDHLVECAHDAVIDKLERQAERDQINDRDWDRETLRAGRFF